MYMLIYYNIYFRKLLINWEWKCNFKGGTCVEALLKLQVIPVFTIEVCQRVLVVEQVNHITPRVNHFMWQDSFSSINCDKNDMVYLYSLVHT